MVLQLRALLTAHLPLSLPPGVLSLVTVQPAAAPVAKQLLPKTLGPSNVNVAAHMQHVPHVVSVVWTGALHRTPASSPLKFPRTVLFAVLLRSVLMLCKPLHYHCEVTGQRVGGGS